MKKSLYIWFAHVLIWASTSMYFCVSCPTARASEAWCGTAPLCSGECRQGATQLKTDSSGNGKKCLTGHKALCTSNAVANPCSGAPIYDIYLSCWWDDSGNVDCGGESETEISESVQELTLSNIRQGLVSNLPPITETWPTLSDGDCQLQNAKLVYHPQGFAEFTSQVRTNHAGSGGDSWVATLIVQDGHGHEVFAVPSFSSHSMKQNGHWYSWKVGFTFDVTKFPQISKTDMKKHC